MSNECDTRRVIPKGACGLGSSGQANLNLRALFAELNALALAGRSQDFAVTTPSWGASGHFPAKPRHRTPLGRGSQGATARDRRGVLQERRIAELAKAWAQVLGYTAGR